MNEEEIGRIVDKRHFDTICKFYDDSVSSIAEVIIGGRDKFREDIRFIPPTVLPNSRLKHSSPSTASFSHTGAPP